MPSPKPAPGPQRRIALWLLVAASLGLGLGCCAAKPDWRAQAIAAAEAGMRDQLADPTARFSRVQLTGDDKTGQTCGYAYAKTVKGGAPYAVRFIVYIDGTAGPYVEENMGKTYVAPGDFDRAWQADCVTEGYNS